MTTISSHQKKKTRMCLFGFFLVAEITGNKDLVCMAVAIQPTEVNCYSFAAFWPIDFALGALESAHRAESIAPIANKKKPAKKAHTGFFFLV